MRPRVLAAALIVTAACGYLSAPRLPQVEQAVQVTHGGGERLRAHQRCAQVSHTVEDLVACMREEGYDFIARGSDYPSSECWSARGTDAEVGGLPPHCFEHAAGTTH